jgi:anti-sigma factor RsiW
VEHLLHVTEDQLELYVLDRLPDSDLPQLEEHLMTCANCRDRLDEIGAFALGMREASGLKTEPRTDWLKWLRRPAAYRFD